MIVEKLKHIEKNIAIKYSPLIDLSTQNFEDVYSHIVKNSNNELNFFWIGRREYKNTWDLQSRIQEKVKENVLNGIVLLLEHDPVYTIGKNADESNLLPSIPANIKVVQTDRGGDVTYHGPGQLVGYPIIDLRKYNKSIPAFMRGLETSCIELLSQLGIFASTKEGLTGVWVDDKKIVALGVRLSRWVSMHGFAINVSTDIQQYRGIIPCGISDYGITSIERLKSTDFSLYEISLLLVQYLTDMISSLGRGTINVKV